MSTPTESAGSNIQTPVIRWTPSLARLPALSVRQPWAWLIVNGAKDIENRSWHTHLRGPLLIHAVSSLDGYTENIEWVRRQHGISVPLELDRGGIVGLVDVIDCVKSHKSKWFEKGGFGWVLANPGRLKFRACKGAVRLFRPKWNIYSAGKVSLRPNYRGRSFPRLAQNLQRLPRESVRLTLLA
jgi:hypothetical protein